MAETVFDYFYNHEAEQFAFYRIPKALFTDDSFRDLSSDAKIVYGLMLDRLSLSIKKEWVDEENRAYIIFTLEQVMEYMNCGKDKGVKILAELDSEKGIGLIERVKQGQGKPALIYVKKFQSVTKAKDKENAGEKQQASGKGKEEIKTSEKPKSGLLKNRSQEFGKPEVKTSEKPKSGLLENRSQEFGKTDPTKTDYSKTDTSKTNTNYNINTYNTLSVHPSSVCTSCDCDDETAVQYRKDGRMHLFSDRAKDEKQNIPVSKLFSVCDDESEVKYPKDEKQNIPVSRPFSVCDDEAVVKDRREEERTKTLCASLSGKNEAVVKDRREEEPCQDNSRLEKSVSDLAKPTGQACVFPAIPDEPEQLVNLVKSVYFEILNSKEAAFLVNGRKLPAETVKSVCRELSEMHFRQVVRYIKCHSISNLNAVVTALYNSPKYVVLENYGDSMQKPIKSGQDKFKNFTQREYDYAKLEAMLLNRTSAGGEKRESDK